MAQLTKINRKLSEDNVEEIEPEVKEAGISTDSENDSALSYLGRLRLYGDAF